MQVLRFAAAQPPAWTSPNINAQVRKWVPFREGQEQVDISFIRFPPGVCSTFHVHATDQLLIAVDGTGFVETEAARDEFAAVTSCIARQASGTATARRSTTTWTRSRSWSPRVCGSDQQATWPQSRQYAERPPSAAIVSPVIILDSSLARNNAILAMSIGSPTPNGCSRQTPCPESRIVRHES